jgi:hypothetical protein
MLDEGIYSRGRGWLLLTAGPASVGCHLQRLERGLVEHTLSSEGGIPRRPLGKGNNLIHYLSSSSLPLLRFFNNFNYDENLFDLGLLIRRTTSYAEKDS